MKAVTIRSCEGIMHCVSAFRKGNHVSRTCRLQLAIRPYHLASHLAALTILYQVGRLRTRVGAAMAMFSPWYIAFILFVFFSFKRGYFFSSSLSFTRFLPSVPIQSVITVLI
jgi:hypothetical protein